SLYYCQQRACMIDLATDKSDAHQPQMAAEQSLVAVRIDPLIRITQAIETAATLDELLLLSLHELTRLLEVERGGVALLEDGDLRLVCEYPPQVAAPGMSLTDLPLVHTALRERRPVQISCAEWGAYPPPVA